MSQTPEPSRRAEEKHPEIFRDPDAGQATFDHGRPPESPEVGALTKGCLWAIVLTAVLLLIVAVTWRWAWEEAPPRLPNPAERDRAGAAAGLPELPRRAGGGPGGGRFAVACGEVQSAYPKPFLRSLRIDIHEPYFDRLLDGACPGRAGRRR